MMALRMIAAVGLLCLCFDSTTVAGSYCADSDCGSGAMVEVWCSEGEDLCKTTDCGANGVWCPSETDSTAVAGSYCADFDCEDGSANVWCDESEERCNSLECSNGVWCPSETAATDAPEITTATPAATEAPDTATITVQGYLVDNFCVEAGEALDNQAVMNTEPEKHTTFCCLMDICVNSGFAILTNDGTADAPDWVVAYQLDDASDDTAKALLEDTDKVDNLMVDATGVLTDNELTLTTLVFTSEEADTPTIAPVNDGTEIDSMAARHSASHFVAATAVVVAAFAL